MSAFCCAEIEVIALPPIAGGAPFGVVGEGVPAIVDEEPARETKFASLFGIGGRFKNYTFVVGVNLVNVTEQGFNPIGAAARQAVVVDAAFEIDPIRAVYFALDILVVHIVG